MVQAVVYLIEGPRSISDAIEKFNKTDHSKSIFTRKSGLSSNLKKIIGNDFSVSTLSKRYGVAIEEQIVNEKPTKYEIHIKIGNAGIGRHFNTIMIINRDIMQDLFKPVYMIDCGDMEITETNWINITVPKSKLKGVAVDE